VCAATLGCVGAGRDVNCALPSPVTERETSAMKNFIAPLSFTLAAAWVVVLFMLVHNNP
jgi:hypothetical protein